MNTPRSREPERFDDAGWGDPQSADGFGASTLHGQARRPSGTATARPVVRGASPSRLDSSNGPREPSFYPVPAQGATSTTSEPSFPDRLRHSEPRPPEPVGSGVPGWLAVLTLMIITGVGGAIDQVSGASSRPGFNYGLVVASLVAILVVRRRAMFPVVIAPPLVYVLGSAAQLYLRSGDGTSKRTLLIDAASNWLVYGFVSIAIATAIVLVVAVARTVLKR